MNKNWAIAGIVLSIAALATVSVLSITPSADAAKPQPQPQERESIAISIAATVGEVTCPGNVPENNVGIGTFNFLTKNTSFSLSKSDFGTINNRLMIGLLDENGGFEIKGIVTADNACFEPTPTVMTLSGQCGLNQEVTYTTDTGIEATYTANVACI
jgi:hypothetical protein